MQNSIERTIPYYKLKVIFKSPSKIVSHFHFKDVLPKKLYSGNAHSFKCNSGNAVYYSKTKCHCYVRVAEHIGISHLTNKPLKSSGKLSKLVHFPNPNVKQKKFIPEKTFLYFSKKTFSLENLFYLMTWNDC